MGWNGRLPQPSSPDAGLRLGESHVDVPMVSDGTSTTDCLPGFPQARLPTASKPRSMPNARESMSANPGLMADRIQAGAVRRCGKLLKEVPSGQGFKNQNGRLRDGAVTRQEAARDAGLSERQKVAGLRVASVPGIKFNALIEAPSPPGVTRVSQLGTHGRVRVGPNFIGTEQTDQARIIFCSIRVFCERTNPTQLAFQFPSQDVKSLRELVQELHKWLDEFAKNLPDDAISSLP